MSGKIDGNMIKQNVINNTTNTVTIIFDVQCAKDETVVSTQDIAAHGPLANEPGHTAAEGEWVMALMLLKYTLYPRNMNYKYPQTIEDGAPSSIAPHEVKGYYLKCGENLRHKPYEYWRTCNSAGAFGDKASTGQKPPLSLGGGQYGWEGGSYHWLIPLKHRGVNPSMDPTVLEKSDSAISPESAGIEIFTITQKFSITSSPDPATIGTGAIIVKARCTKNASIPPSAELESTVSL